MVYKETRERFTMTVQELIDHLQTINDKSLEVRVLENNPSDPENNTTNYWLDGISVADKEQSGYELSGEVVLVGNE